MLWHIKYIHLVSSRSCLLCSSSTPSQCVSWRGVKYRFIISSIAVCSFSVSGHIAALMFLSTVERSHMDTSVVVTCVFKCMNHWCVCVCVCVSAFVMTITKYQRILLQLINTLCIWHGYNTIFTS